MPAFFPLAGRSFSLCAKNWAALIPSPFFKCRRLIFIPFKRRLPPPIERLSDVYRYLGGEKFQILRLEPVLGFVALLKVVKTLILHVDELIFLFSRHLPRESRLPAVQYANPASPCPHPSPRTHDTNTSLFGCPRFPTDTSDSKKGQRASANRNHKARPEMSLNEKTQGPLFHPLGQSAAHLLPLLYDWRPSHCFNE